MLIRDHIAQHHADLSPQLRVAANYVAEHPTEIATRSLRAVAHQLNLSPATFTRLSKALGFSSYESMKEVCRKNLHHQSHSLAARAKALQKQHAHEEAEAPLLYQHANAVIDNINEMLSTLDIKKLQAVANELGKARRVFLLGALSSAAFSQLWSYIAHLAFNHWHCINEGDGRLAAHLSGMTDLDMAVLITKKPHASWAILAAQEIHQAGGKLLLLTDSLSCPALPLADHYFVISDGSPQFFSSYTTLLVLVETLMGMIVASAGNEAAQHIATTEDSNYRLGKYWREQA